MELVSRLYEGANGRLGTVAPVQLVGVVGMGVWAALRLRAFLQEKPLRERIGDYALMLPALQAEYKKQLQMDPKAKEKVRHRHTPSYRHVCVVCGMCSNLYPSLACVACDVRLTFSFAALLCKRTIEKTNNNTGLYYIQIVYSAAPRGVGGVWDPHHGDPGGGLDRRGHHRAGHLPQTAQTQMDIRTHMRTHTPHTHFHTLTHFYTYTYTHRHTHIQCRSTRWASSPTSHWSTSRCQAPSTPPLSSPTVCSMSPSVRPRSVRHPPLRIPCCWLIAAE
jgi:hypothetical protein